LSAITEGGTSRARYSAWVRGRDMAICSFAGSPTRRPRGEIPNSFPRFKTSSHAPGGRVKSDHDRICWNLRGAC
jgi:hypothetical protein